MATGFTATFYNFNKRVNSTKRPSGGTSYSIILKAGSSAYKPTISLDIGQDGNPSSYNYVYIGVFNRYYFIEDWVFENRLWSCICKCDPLASFKGSIGSYKGYVVRSASNYNMRVVDNYYPALANNSHKAEYADSPFVSDLSNGRYVIGVQGRDAGDNGGAVTYYVATQAQMVLLERFMMSDAASYEVDDISEKLLMCIFNPMQYIVSCMWFPFSPPMVSIGGVYFGWWTATGTGINQLAKLNWGNNFSVPIPKHPKAETRGAYLNLPPYSRYKFEAGPWGIIPLDNFNLMDADKLSVLWNVDLITGSGRLSIRYRDALLHESVHTAQIGVPIQLGQNMMNQGALESAGAGIGGVVQSALSGNVAGMISSGMGAIGDAAKLTQSVPSTIGSNGTLSFNNSFGIMADFLDIADEDLESRGRPLCKPVTIGSLSGYVMCQDADPAINCTDLELKEIVNYMNSGFYYE